MIKARFALPDKKFPTSPMPSELVSICLECGNRITPLFYRGQWRKRICQCETVKIRQSEQEAQEVLWREKAVKSTYAWLTPLESSVNALKTMYSQSFSTFDITRQGSQLQQKYQTALKSCMDYAENPKGNLALWGTTGVGKTHLLLAICNELREQHHTIARFVVFSEFMRVLHSQQRNPDEQERLLRVAKNAKLLVLDDVDTLLSLDASWQSEIREQIIFEVLNYRFNAELPIALSANLLFPVYKKVIVDGKEVDVQVHPGLVKFLGEKAMSRLKANLVPIGLEGQDQREAR